MSMTFFLHRDTIDKVEAVFVRDNDHLLIKKIQISLLSLLSLLVVSRLRLVLPQIQYPSFIVKLQLLIKQYDV